jgi:hypothetical protein
MFDRPRLPGRVAEKHQESSEKRQKGLLVWVRRISDERYLKWIAYWHYSFVLKLIRWFS